jgi:hypothetical protein
LSWISDIHLQSHFFHEVGKRNSHHDLLDDLLSPLEAVLDWPVILDLLRSHQCSLTRKPGIG